jgi:hypothetical protein
MGPLRMGESGFEVLNWDRGAPILGVVVLDGELAVP